MISSSHRLAAGQKETIAAVEAWVLSPSWKPYSLMMPLLKACYDEDVFTDEAILDWAAEAADRGEESVKLKDQCKQLLEFLEDSDDDDDEDDDDE